MAGTGNRFVEAGYAVPKPLIEVDNMPMIEHVVNLFPGESNFLFICNNNHLKSSGLEEVLRRIAPECRVVGMEPQKKGPVFSVCEFIDLVQDGEVIVNYCDFGAYWDYNDFLNHTRRRNADGAIPSYRGFHPHMLHLSNYAFIRDEKQWMLKIQEKKPFTDDRMSEFASNGTYYFREGEYVRTFFPRLMELDIRVEGEYYVSMVYNLLMEAGLRISVYEIQHMLQWGTPQDMEEYIAWSDYFREAIEERKSRKHRGTLLMPLAGKGARFAEDYDIPKPLIPISGRPMFSQAVSGAPGMEKEVFVCLSEHEESFGLSSEINTEYPGARVVLLDGVTDGQAATARLGLDGIDPEEPVFVAACDNGMIWNEAEYVSLIEENDTDVVVWTFSGNPCVLRDPGMFGWVVAGEPGRAAGISVKKPVSDNPLEDRAVIGAFYFSSAGLFIEGYERLVSEDIRVNGEFYIDSLVDVLAGAGYCVKVFEVDHYVCWGTPDDLRTYEYWQSFFHKCSIHPYSLEADPLVPPGAVHDIAAKYSNFAQENE